MTMSPKQRLITTLERNVPDRLPVTTHHIMPYFLNKYMDGITNDQFFDYFKMDPVHWTNPIKEYSDLGRINPFTNKGYTC
jgi:uroporphyrinogen decarboxylase